MVRIADRLDMTSAVYRGRKVANEKNQERERERAVFFCYFAIVYLLFCCLWSEGLPFLLVLGKDCVACLKRSLHLPNNYSVRTGTHVQYSS